MDILEYHWRLMILTTVFLGCDVLVATSGLIFALIASRKSRLFLLLACVFLFASGPFISLIASGRPSSKDDVLLVVVHLIAMIMLFIYSVIEYKRISNRRSSE